MSTRKQRGVALTVLGVALSLALGSAVFAQAEDSASVTMDDVVADQEKRHAAQRALESVDPASAPAVATDEDHQLVQLGLPELGGIWLDETSDGAVVTLAVVRAPGLKIDAVAARVQQTLLTIPRSDISAVPAILALREAGTDFKTVEVKYSFAQLKEWQALMEPLFKQGWVTMSDADERRNTVTLGVPSTGDIDRVVDFGVQRAVPRDALSVGEFLVQPSQ